MIPLPILDSHSPERPPMIPLPILDSHSPPVRVMALHALA